MAGVTDPADHGAPGHGHADVAQVTKKAAGAQLRLPGGHECEFAAHRCDPSPHSRMPPGRAAGLARMAEAVEAGKRMWAVLREAATAASAGLNPASPVTSEVQDR
jgi:hypothetical protein